MLSSIAREQTADCAFPALQLITANSMGFLTDVSSAEFQIYDVSTDSKALDPVQVYPATVGLRAPVPIDVTAPAPGSGRLGIGRYAGTWTPGAAEPIGRHQVRWYWSLPTDSRERVETEEFDVLPAGCLGALDQYALVSDLRDEGVPSVGTYATSDLIAMRKLALASRIFERWTGRSFVPTWAEYHLDGSGAISAMLDTPIVAIESVRYDLSPTQPRSIDVPQDGLRIYNRHLRGVALPDDRNNPKVALYQAGREAYDMGMRPRAALSPAIFPRGEQNVHITGVFGYTDSAYPSTMGRVPLMVRRAVMLLVLREIDKLTSSRRWSALLSGRIVSEHTREQSVSYEPAGKSGQGRSSIWSGDPEIDTIVAAYLRPPMLGAA